MIITIRAGMFIVRDSDNSTVLTDFTPRKMISFQTLEKKKKQQNSVVEIHNKDLILFWVL